MCWSCRWVEPWASKSSWKEMVVSEPGDWVTVGPWKGMEATQVPVVGFGETHAGRRLPGGINGVGDLSVPMKAARDARGGGVTEAAAMFMPSAAAAEEWAGGEGAGTVSIMVREKV